MTLSNALGPTDLDGRCPRLGGSDCEELGGVEFGVEANPDVVVDEVEVIELDESAVSAEFGGM